MISMRYLKRYFLLIFLPVLFTKVKTDAENGGIQLEPDYATAVLGDGAVLPCRFFFPENTIEYIVQWQKQDVRSPIYLWHKSYRHKSYPPHAGEGYKDRVSIIGQAALNLSTVQQADEGWYECTVHLLSQAPYSPPLNGSWVHLDVIDGSSLQRMERESDDTDTLTNIRNLIRQARTETGDIDLNALLSDNVYDPVPLQNFNISSNGFMTNIFGQFTDLNLHGLKGFRVDRVAMNLAKMNLSADMSVPILSIVGSYFLQGSVTFFSVSGEGPFWMNMSSIVLKGHSLVKSTPEGRLSVGDINLESNVENIGLHFENLMGGGTWGSISNSLLNQLSELILGELKPSLLRELSSYLKHQFDDVLFQQLPAGFMNPSSTNLIDSLLEKASVYMVDNEIDPLKLQDYKEVYERNLLFVTTRGEFKLFNGTLHGLSTISRKGDVITVFANNSLIFEADFEFSNLTGGYSWIAEVFTAGTTGNMEIQVKSVQGFVKLKQDLKSGSKLELDTLYVKDIRHVWLDLQGLGRWDYIMESVINLVTNGLKLQLADAIAEQVQKSVQEELDTLNIGIP